MNCYSSRFNKGDLEGAMECYRAALEVNPDLESARDQLQTVQNKLELQALRVGAASKWQQLSQFTATCSFLCMISALSCFHSTLQTCDFYGKSMTSAVM